MQTSISTMIDVSQERVSGAKLKIAALMDTSFGFGTPQLELFIDSLRNYFDGAECWLLEPDTKGKRRLTEKEGFNYRRFATRHVYGGLYQIDLAMQMHRFLKSYDPDIVVVTSGNLLPALLKLGKKPPLVIYYMFENMQYQNLHHPELLQLNQMAEPWVDLICVPERDRASFDLKSLRWSDKPCIEVLNVSAHRYLGDARNRSFRLIHAGSIAPDTMPEMMDTDLFNDVPVDVFGILANEGVTQMLNSMGSRRRKVVYKGILSAEKLEQAYPDYAFSIVCWRPTNINQIYASPNKLFQAISLGVPPISAPHPQCRRIIERYHCGIVMDNWSLNAFVAAVRRARDLFGSPDYDRMVENCRAATEVELNWPAQFGKVAKHLDAMNLAGRQSAVLRA